MKLADLTLVEDRGAGLVEYALLVALIAMAGLVAVSTLGESTSETFDEASAGLANGAEAEEELTPDEEWELAKEEYAEAIDEAKADRAAEIAAAKAGYDAAREGNKALPKSERKSANKAAKDDYNSAKSAANDTYKAAVQKAKDDKAAAKANYKASK